MGFLDRLLKKDTLEQVFRDLAQSDTPERRRTLYKLLLEGTLILATPHEDPTNRSRTSDGSLQIGFIATSDANGKPAMLAFTSEAALLAWRPAGCTYTSLAARDVFRMALQKEMETIVVNPNGPSGGYLTRLEFTTLAEGLFPDSPSQNVPSGGIAIASPSPLPPEEWLASLRRHARAMTSIRGLYLVNASINGGPHHYLMGIDLASGAKPDDAIPPFLESIRPTIESGAYVDFVPLGSDSLGGEIRSKGLRIL
jgi:hypothetical protein